MTLRNRVGAEAHPIAPLYARTISRSGGLAAASEALPSGVARPETEGLPGVARNGHVVLDDFDGVHRGHQAAIGHASRQARLHRGPVIALSYDPPRPTTRLTSHSETARLLVRAGADAVVTLSGPDRPSSSERFIADLLTAKLGAQSLVIGAHGVSIANEVWSAGALAELAPAHGLTVHVLPTIADPKPVSTVGIRRALSQGDVAAASEMLGRFWAVEGMVVHGAKRGRARGMRTATVAIGEGAALAHGVYAVRALAKKRICDGVASFGRRPQFDNGEPLLEVHLFDFDDDLYGDVLRVEFVGWLRGEASFSTVPALVAQMNDDVVDARRALGVASRITRSALHWTEPLEARRVIL